MAKFTWGAAGYDLPRLFTEHFYAPQVTVVSRTSTGFVMEYNDFDHTRVVAKGSKLSYGADGLPTKGTITSWTASSDAGFIGTAKNLKMSAAALMAAATSEGRADEAFYSKVLSGKDAVTGHQNNDYLNGFAGNDTLIGGRGDDLLVGGKGADRFVYKSVADSSMKSGETDFIADFSRAQKDKIDLKAIDANITKAGNQAFTFIGKGDFTKKAGQLRYEYYQNLDEGGDGINLLGDVNGDGIADFKIFIANNLNLVKGDFYL